MVLVQDLVTWHDCVYGKPGCGSTPPMPPGVAGLWEDPILVADGKGNVAYVQMGTDGNNSQVFVVAALSSDRGQTFPAMTLVNDDQSPSAPSSCLGGYQDQPSADFNITTDINHARKISVVWRHKAAQLSTWGACVRTGSFCGVNETDPACNNQPRPSIVWKWGSGTVLSGLTRYDSLYGQSGVIVQSGDGAVAVVDANCDGSMVNCPDTSLHGCTWERVISYDEGDSWSSAVSIDTTTVMKNCVVNGGSPPNGGAIEARHRSTFAFARDRRNGDYYVATMHGQSDLRLFRSQNQGGSWTQVRQFSNPSARPTITLPTLASDTAGRLALTYIESLPGDTVVEPVFASVASVTSPDNPDPPPDPNNWAFSVLTSTPYQPPVGNNRAIGDYNGIAVMDPTIDSSCVATSSFLPAWTDTLRAPASFPFLVHVQEVDVSP